LVRVERLCLAARPRDDCLAPHIREVRFVSTTPLGSRISVQIIPLTSRSLTVSFDVALTRFKGSGSCLNGTGLALPPCPYVGKTCPPGGLNEAAKVPSRRSTPPYPERRGLADAFPPSSVHRPAELERSGAKRARPVLPAAHSETQPDSHADVRPRSLRRWQSHMLTFGSQHCLAPTRGTLDERLAATYYDSLRVYLNILLYTRDPKWNQCIAASLTTYGATCDRQRRSRARLLEFHGRASSALPADG
jgi:hypothetical protein